jgi:hypothetical protein
MAQGRNPGRSPIRILLLLLAGLVAVVTAALVGRGGSGVDRTRPIGLFTSLPILWRETHDLSDLLRTDAPRHWALEVIERHGRVRPLDTLAAGDGKLPLARHGLLVVIQPRALAPQENVALDNWVRSGGRVLLFADPMLTSQSAFALGDRRRPQDVVLLSPILARWGLELRFDESQPYGERKVDVLGRTMPVNLPGSFAVVAGDPGCGIESQGLVARCRIGDGRLLAVADAALFERDAADAPQRRAVLDRLLAE